MQELQHAIKRERTYQYDWFTHNIPTWERFVLPLLPKNPAVLELGAFEGRATVWMNETLQPSRQAAVDTWEGSVEHEAAGIDMNAVYQRFYDNVDGLGIDINICETFDALTKYLRGDSFDLIYVDASHTALDVLTDGLLAWRLLKPGGIMIFDDYEWPGGKDVYDRPKLGIDVFLTVLNPGDWQFLHKGYQVILLKSK